jgi:hypothetical protein
MIIIIYIVSFFFLQAIVQKYKKAYLDNHYSTKKSLYL